MPANHADGPASRHRLAGARLAEATVLSRRLAESEYRLADCAEALIALDAESPAQVHSAEIGHGIGTVEVDGAGSLLDITLRPRGGRMPDPGVLAEGVLTALHAAEAQAHDAYVSRLHRAAAGGRPGSRPRGRR